MEYAINRMQATDWKEVRAIYLEGIATGNATFETEAPEWEAWDEGHLVCCRFVARSNDGVAGWAGLSPISKRDAYRGVGEVSVYVATPAQGKGVGKALLAELIRCSEENGIWTLQASILAENTASLALHEQCGFRVIGRREKISQVKSAWRDVILMERRSTRVGKS